MVSSKSILWTLPAGVWSIVILYLSLMDGDAIPSKPWMDAYHLDKAVHTGLYFVLLHTYFLAIKRTNNVRNVMALSCVLAIGMGFVTEMLQWGLTPSRHFELLDLMANITGVAIAAFLIKKVY